MSEEDFTAAEKIVLDIENIYKKDSELSSFEVVPIENNENKSPVFHGENSLGLASWCIKPLYCYVYNHLINTRQNKYHREEPTTISRWLLVALLLNPDVITFWNMKKELIKNGRVDPVDELRFINVVLQNKPKCFEAFSYRRWILKFLCDKRVSAVSNIHSLFNFEFNVVKFAADKYRNNIHAWNHRKHIISLQEKYFKSEYKQCLYNEWNESTNWCERHISDFSGFSYKQFLLFTILLFSKNLKPDRDHLKKSKEVILEFIKVNPKFGGSLQIINSSSSEFLGLIFNMDTLNYSQLDCENILSIISLWAEDCLSNEQLIDTYPGHETLWSHRQFLIHFLLILSKLENKKSMKELRDSDSFIKLSLKYKCEKLYSNFIFKNLQSSIFIVSLQIRNKNLVANAKSHGDYHNQLAIKFVNFLSFMNLEL